MDTRRYSLWLCCQLCIHIVLAAPPHYEPRVWNKSCNYTISGIPAPVFFNRSTSTDKVMFPISPGYRMPVPDGDQEYLSTVQLSCFSPGARVNQTLVAAGLKMPCGYSVQPDGTVDYWEEGVCEVSLRSNCYCYSINAPSNDGYCIPGFASLKTTNVDFSSESGNPCADALKKVELDGGKPVTRQEVYSAQLPSKGHYIALVVWPNSDFHFFRRDAEGWWSQKRGDTFVTNTYPNGTVVTDVEDPAILGAYRQFCGYFLVDPETHAKTESTWTYSSVPKRLVAAKDAGYTVSSTPLRQPSTGWMRLNYPYLLFGLDAAVFESGNRRLPWQDTQPSAVVSEAGKQHGGGAAIAVSGQQASTRNSNLPAHWFSHAQHKTTVQERDRATRAQYAALARRSQGLHGMHVTQRTAVPS